MNNQSDSSYYSNQQNSKQNAKMESSHLGNLSLTRNKPTAQPNAQPTAQPTAHPTVQFMKVSVRKKLQLLVPIEKQPYFNSYEVVKVLHGVRTDHLKNRIRWDDNQLVRDYFGTNLEGQQLSNRQNSGSPKSPLINMKPSKFLLSSVLEINPHHFESSQKSCSRRFKAEKYNHLQKYFDEYQWDKLFGKTDKMKYKEKREKLRQSRQETLIQNSISNSRHVSLAQNVSPNPKEIQMYKKQLVT